MQRPEGFLEEVQPLNQPGAKHVGHIPWVGQEPFDQVPKRPCAFSSVALWVWSQDIPGAPEAGVRGQRWCCGAVGPWDLPLDGRVQWPHLGVLRKSLPQGG